MKKKVVLKMVVGMLMASLLISTTGCGQKVNTKETIGGKGEIPKEISVFASRQPSLGNNNMTDFNEVLGFKMMEEATGCHINWTLPPADGYTEKFNLMIASGQYTDAIVYGWRGINAKEYADDGVILPLSDMIEECMPNFSKWCKENPEYAKQFKSNDGEIYYIPYIRTDERLNIFLGPQIRTDWLEKLGLEVPQNADELYNVLKAFKTRIYLTPEQEIYFNRNDF